MEKEISEMRMKQNQKHQVQMEQKTTELQEMTYNKTEIAMLVNMTEVKTYQRPEEEKPGRTTPNLKRDTTHAIVSPLKKPRQTEEDSGLMQTE